MERPQALPNLWLIVKTLAWALAIGAASEIFSTLHSVNVIRRLISVVLGRDPARPEVPSTGTEWEEWYNS